MKVEIDVDVWDLMRELSDEDIAAEHEKRLKEARPRRGLDTTDKLIAAIEHDAMETALWHWANGRTDDALFHLETALGRDWAGLSDLDDAPACSMTRPLPDKPTKLLAIALMLAGYSATLTTHEAKK